MGVFGVSFLFRVNLKWPREELRFCTLLLGFICLYSVLCNRLLLLKQLDILKVIYYIKASCMH